MKIKFMKLGVATLALSIILGNSSYSQSIELLNKDNEKYMPVKLFVKKLGGQYKEMEDGYTFNVNGRNITVEEYASFAKIDNQYEPLKVSQIDGWNVPTDTESIYQENEVYIPALFLQSFQVADYSIIGNDLVVEKEKVIVKAPVIVDKHKDVKPKPIPVYSPKPQPKPQPQEPVNIEEPNKDNKPEDNTNNQNNNSENNNSNDQNNNQNNNTDNNENSNTNNNQNPDVQVPQEPIENTNNVDNSTSNITQ